MADNTTLDAGSGGDTIATDDIGGVKFQRVKLIIGADGTNDGDVASGNPLPIVGNVSLTGSASVAISGTVTVADGAVSSLSSSYTVAIKGTPNVEVVGDVSLTGSMSVVVSGSVTVADGAVASLSSSYTVAIKGTPNVEIAGDVSLTGSISVVISSGSVTVSGAVSLTGSMSVLVAGMAAHDAAVAGNPVLMGLEARTTNPTAVASGDAVRAMADDVGRQVMVIASPRDLVTEAHLTSLSASTTQTLLAAGGAGVFHDITHIALSNFSASVANVKIFDGAAGEKWRFDLAADGGGAIIVLPVPFRQATANAVWAIQSTEPDVAVTVQAVKNV